MSKRQRSDTCSPSRVALEAGLSGRPASLLCQSYTASIAKPKLQAIAAVVIGETSLAHRVHCGNAPGPVASAVLSRGCARV
jgi:hypothetical protein